MSGSAPPEDTPMDGVFDGSAQVATPTQSSAALHPHHNGSSAEASGSGVIRGADGAMFLVSLVSLSWPGRVKQEESALT